MNRVPKISEHHQKFRVSIIAISDILVILAVRLVPIDLPTIDNVEEDPEPTLVES